MKAAIKLEGQARETTGKGAGRALRGEGMVPVIIYGNGKENVTLSLEERYLQKEYSKGGFFSKVVEIEVGKKKLHALPKEIQTHPVSDRIQHVDFLHIDEKSTITVQVPVRFLNMERCVGIKRGGTLNIVRRELELKTTPANIPDVIEIDIAETNIGDSIHISHIALPEGVEPTITDRDFTVATLAGRTAKEETESTEETAEEATEEEEAVAE